MTTFLRDWLPSLAIIAAGVWTFVRWCQNEYHRRQKEMEALDGKLLAHVTQLSIGTSIITLNGLWRNLSPLPVPLDTSKTRVNIFAIPGNIPLGPLAAKSGFGEPIYCHTFLNDANTYTLEPKTESTLQTHFVLNPGLYMLRMELYRASKKKGYDFAWTRELLLDTRDPQQPAPGDRK